jgi:hypothetical protein
MAYGSVGSALEDGARSTKNPNLYGHLLLSFHTGPRAAARTHPQNVQATHVAVDSASTGGHINASSLSLSLQILPCTRPSFHKNALAKSEARNPKDETKNKIKIQNSNAWLWGLICV